MKELPVGRPRFQILLGVATAVAVLSPLPAVAAWGTVHADFSGCPSQYVSGTADEPVESQTACVARINAIANKPREGWLACARYTCVPNGSGGAPSTGGAADPATLGMQDIAKG